MFDDFAFHEFAGTAGLRMPYRLLVPGELASAYPLVLFFHGSGERGKDNKKQLVHGVERFARPDSRSRYPCFVLAPQCPTDLDKQPIMWAGERERMHSLKLTPEVAIPLRTALELLNTIEDNYPIDPDRIYITGISMGGFCRLGSSHPASSKVRCCHPGLRRRRCESRRSNQECTRLGFSRRRRSGCAG
jgi:predicted peptidase